VEWYATEKINVHEAPSLNWGSANNQVNHIRRLNTLLKLHPAFHDRTELKLVQQGGGNHIVLLRHHISSGKKLLVVVNLDDKNQTCAAWNPEQVGMGGPVFTDLLTEEEVVVTKSGRQQTYLLDPGQVLCLTSDQSDIDLIQSDVRRNFMLLDRIKKQRLHAKALDVFRYYNDQDLEKFDPDFAERQLAEDPVEYCRNLNSFSRESRVITWQWPRDLKREVMVPLRHFLLVRAGNSFRAKIMNKDPRQNYEQRPGHGI